MRIRGRVSGDPDSCYPEEERCAEGGFDGDHLCKRMIAAIEEGIQNGVFDGWEFDVVSAAWMQSDEAREFYRESPMELPDVDWSAHPYWQLFYDERAPIGFDTIAEVYRKALQ
jgi:hypothetical protein